MYIIPRQLSSLSSNYYIQIKARQRSGKLSHFNDVIGACICASECVWLRLVWVLDGSVAMAAF